MIGSPEIKVIGTIQFHDVSVTYIMTLTLKRENTFRPGKCEILQHVT